MAAERPSWSKDDLRRLRVLGVRGWPRRRGEPLARRVSYSMSKKLDMIPLQAHSHLALGQFHSRGRDYAQSRKELTRALELYKKAEMKSWQGRAEAALCELSLLEGETGTAHAR